MDPHPHTFYVTCRRYVAMLYDLVSNLGRPCLRMRMLQEVLGLDARFSRDITFGVVRLTFDPHHPVLTWRPC